MPPFPTIPALHAAYEGGLDPRAVVAGAYRRIAEIDDPGIFLALVPEAEALAAADALGAFDPQAKPLWGVPFAVKDNIDVAGLPTTAACPDFAFTPTETAAAVARLLAAGAILIGKTNLDQFATGLVGVRTPYPVPRNAIDPAYVPGGSSSGSAVAVSHGIVAFALGTDTAGSGRVPAGLNNVVGLKPSLGAVSSRGMLPACRTLDTISVFAGTVADADAAFRVMAGFDPADPWSRPLPVAPVPAGLPPGLRLGVPDGPACASGAMRSRGRLRRHDGGPPGHRRAGRRDRPRADVRRGRPPLRRPLGRRALRSDPRRDGDAAGHPPRDDAGGDRHGDPPRGGGCLRRPLPPHRIAPGRRRGLVRVDVLCVPTYPRPQTRAALAADPIGPNSELGTYTNFVNLLDWCALAVPGRARADGFPAGITLIGPRGADGLLAALGARLHAASAERIGASRAPVPPAQDGPARALPGEIELVVVGAHLSGCPSTTS